MKKYRLYLAALCVAAASLTGCSNENTSAANVTDITSAAQSETSSVKTLIGLKEAENAALVHAGISETEAEITRSELDRDKGNYEYEIEFTAKNYKYEYDINAEDGSVMSFSKEAVPEKAADTAAQTSPKIETSPETKKTETARTEAPVTEAPKTEAPRTETTTSAATTQKAAVPSPAEKTITAEEAKSAALKHAGLTASEVTFTKTKLDYDDGIAEYDVEFYSSSKEYEYEINASNGMVIKYSTEALELPAMNNSADGKAMITAEDAKAAALEYAGLAASDVKFTKAELDYDDGVAEYEVEFRYGRKEYEFKIDAYSGKILEADID